MKTKPILVAVVALISSVAFAVEPGAPKVVVVNQKEAGVFKVIYEGEKKGNVKLNIADKNGNVVYKETIKGVDGFIRPVNFTGMTPGEYTIEITTETGKQIQKINYTNDSAAKFVHIAKVSEDGKYLLAVANGVNEEISVKIFDGSDNLVHSESVSVKGSLGLVYNLKNVSGTPTFEVSDKTGTVKTVRY